MDLKGYQQYKEQSIATMTQEELLLLLYDELVKRLMQAELALDKKEYPLFEASVQRGIEIIDYLDSTLDRKYEISHNLGRLYEYFDYELGRAKIGRRKEPLTGVKIKAAELRDAFREAARGMEALELQKALSLEKRMYALLNEAFDISKQLAEAIERGDQVTIRILLSMRREPLESLRRIRRALEEQRDALAPAQARQLAELLNGAAAAGKEEERLAEQVAVNGRLLRQLVELDRILNRKLGGKKSLYHKSLDTSPTG